jgi:hypothetical protein
MMFLQDEARLLDDVKRGVFFLSVQIYTT